MTTQSEIEQGVKELARLRATDWRLFSDLMHRIIDPMDVRSDESFDVSAEALMALGIPAHQAAAIIFVMTQEYRGRPCDNVDNIDRWFSVNT